MTVHITNLYGMSPQSVAQIAQNQVAQIACNTLNFKELGIYFYDWDNEPSQSRKSRFDGILASLAHGDTIIFQAPTWNSIIWDQQFFDRLSIYKNLKKIIFIEDVVPLMFESNKKLLPKYIDLYNKADVLIVPSQQMVDYLKSNGLKTKKVILQRFWDHICDIDKSIVPQNHKIINFAGNPNKFKFVNNWSSGDVQLNVFSKITKNPNSKVNYMGWQEDHELLFNLRKQGGFGLVWCEEPYYKKYMTMNATYKLSTYLAAGIPVLIDPSLQVSDKILQSHLGFVVDNLDQAVEKVKNISDFEYNELLSNVDSFAELIRNGYFTKRALVESIFKSRY